MTTLADMRTLVRQMLDDSSSDTDEQRWSDAEIDFALAAALEGCIALVGRQVSRYDVQTEVTTTSGSADLSALDVLEIKAVEWKSGNVYLPLSAGDYSAPQVQTFDGLLRVTYLPRPTLPANAGDEVTYGAGSVAGLKAFDRLAAIRAALDLLPKDGERNVSLEGQEARALEQVLQMGKTPGAREIRLSQSPFFGSERVYLAGLPYQYRWVWVPGTQALRLVV